MCERPPNVLIVDDDADNCEMLPILFRNDGCTCEFVTCLSVSDARKALLEKRFDLIILDYVMPGISGAEFCREVRNADPSVPIVFYTAQAMTSAREECLDAGATAFLVKPNDIYHIGSLARDLLARNRLNAKASTVSA
jgi:CheY-like chemotaxis protein